MAYYGLTKMDGEVIVNEKDKVARWKENELLKVSHDNEGDIMSVKKANFINSYLLRSKDKRKIW